MMSKRFNAIVACVVLCLTVSSRAAWEDVPAMDWSKVKIEDFTDRELDIPRMLAYFSTVANAVIEDDENRGFLDIKVNRNPEDNKPYNARILENHLALAYFFTADRPWNPYYGSDAVKQRLEAMLEFWLTRHSPDGWLAEYQEGGFNLPATSFGAMFMSQTLELLSKGEKTIDADLLKRVNAAQRKMIMAILQDPRLINAARDWSNQYGGGAYVASMSYLLLHPDDTEMMEALKKAVKDNIKPLQSPAGYLYEAGGPDVGYTGVHENVLRLAAGYLEKPQFAFLKAALDDEMSLYEKWLTYNLVKQPDSNVFYVNSGPLTRTSKARFELNNRPWTQRVETGRAFAQTQAEYTAERAAQRQKLRANWGVWPELKLPNAYAYSPADFFEALHNLHPYFPTDAERQAQIDKLPYLASDQFNFQATDPRPMVHTFVRKPSYYAAFNSGKIRQPARQHYGIGLVWNPKVGTILQSIGGTNLAWGTQPGNADKPYEKGADVLADITVDGKPLTPASGMTKLPDGSTQFTYPLGETGRKIVLMGQDGIDVTIEHPGAFAERLPLIVRENEQVTVAAGKIELVRDGVTFSVVFDNNATPELATAGKPQAGMVNQLVSVKATDRLKYTIRFAGQ